MEIENLGTTEKKIIEDLKDDFLNSLSSIITSSEMLKDLGNNRELDASRFTNLLDKYVFITKNLHEDFNLFFWALEDENSMIENVIAKINSIAQGMLSTKPICTIKLHEASLPDQKLPFLWNFQILKIHEYCLKLLLEYNNTSCITSSLQTKKDGIEINFMYDAANNDLDSLEHLYNSQVYKKIKTLGFKLTQTTDKNFKNINLSSVFTN